jgi:glycosyltransferase involved in cell wall biosynthesis
MKILLVHNYLRPPSGENTVFEQERDLLLSKGDTVFTYIRHNRDIDKMSALKKALIPIRAIWSSDSYYDLVRIIERERPDIAHFHNIFPLISPAAYRACKSRGIPVVQTLHHYRIVCPGALLFRENRVCVECSGMNFLPGIRHGCYRNSPVLTAGIVSVILLHRLIRTWQDSIDLYIVLSDFALGMYKELGFPSNNFFIKPNFLQNPITPTYSDDGYGIYMGRIGEEKGINCLLSALKDCPEIGFKIVGDGPLRDHLKDRIVEVGLRNVEYLGMRDYKECMDLLLGARFHVLPSQWYEGIPMAMLEAMSAGKPSIVSDIGVLPQMVKDGIDGLVFHAGSAEQLSEKIKWIHARPDEGREMGRKARQAFEENYMRERNYRMLMEAYQRAIDLHGCKNGKR